MSYTDVANADFYHLIELFNRDGKNKKEKEENETMSLYDFINSHK